MQDGPVGLDLLNELDDELGLVFWRAVRDVLVWSSTPPEMRVQLSQPPTEAVAARFAAASSAAPTLAEAITEFALLARAAHLVDARALADACHAVYQWADTQGLMRPALHFAEAAALADPADPTRANFAALMCRREVMEQRAGTWYYRAFVLAKRARNDQEQLYALLGCGSLYRDLGRVREARRFILKAARLAGRTGRYREAAEAAHDLMLMESEEGALPAATEHATRAEAWYPVHHPRFIYFAHDFAFLLVRARNYAVAHALLEKAIPLFQRANERVLVWSTLAWAAGGAGRQDRLAVAEAEVLAGVTQYAEYAPAALLHIAEGARACRRWGPAAEYAARAVEAARIRKDATIERDSSELLSAVAVREETPSEEEPSVQLASLARRFTFRLRKAKAPDQQESGATPEGEA